MSQVELTGASVRQLDCVCQICGCVLLALSALGTVVSDQLGVDVDVCHIVDDTADLEACILQ